jgi:hypothetical protein
MTEFVTMRRHRGPFLGAPRGVHFPWAGRFNDQDATGLFVTLPLP